MSRTCGYKTDTVVSFCQCAFTNQLYLNSGTLAGLQRFQHPIISTVPPRQPMKPTGIYLHTHSYTRTLDRPLMWVFLCGIKDRRQQEKKGRTRRFLAPEALECFPKSNVKTIMAHPNGVCGQVLTRMQACSHTCCMSMHAHIRTQVHAHRLSDWSLWSSSGQSVEP